MPRRLKELLVSWRGQMRNCNVLEVWRLALSRLMCCIWREQNVKSFDDRDTLVLELKNMLF